MNGSGRLIPEEAQTHIWVKEVFMMTAHKKEHCPLPNILLPLYGYALRDVVGSFHETLHDNTITGVFTIGMYKLIFCGHGRNLTGVSKFTLFCAFGIHFGVNSRFLQLDDNVRVFEVFLSVLTFYHQFFQNKLVKLGLKTIGEPLSSGTAKR